MKKVVIIGLVVVCSIVCVTISVGFTYFMCPRNDVDCKCLMNSIAKNMSFIDKTKFLVTGADHEDLIPYLNLGDAMKCSIVAATDLQNGTLDDWNNAPIDRKAKTIKSLTSQGAHVEKLIECVDKTALLPDSKDFLVRDATKFCFMGLKLKN